MTVNFAMIATGRIAGNQLAPAVAQAEGARLWSVLSRDRRRAADFAARHGAAAASPACDDLDELLADPELDAVIIASPDRLHAGQGIAAARAGKHVFTEKPMAADRPEGRALVEACRDAGVKLGVAFHMRWHAGHRALAAAAHSGRFGPLRHMRVMWTQRAPDGSNWRASPEVGRWWSLGGLGPHCLDQVRWFLLPSAGEVRAIESVIDRSVWNSVHDETAVVALHFENGATAEICTSVQFRSPRRMEVYGEEGWAIAEETFGYDGTGRIRTSEGEFGFPVRNPYVGEVRDFVLAIEEDREPEVGGEEGLRNTDLLLRAVGA